MHHNRSAQVTTNPASWLIFEQMLTIAARKVDSYFNDVAVVDAACMATHNPADRFYWMIDVWGSHWGAANLAGVERMRASIKVFGYRNTLEYYLYDPRTGLSQTTKELIVSAITRKGTRIVPGLSRQPIIAREPSPHIVDMTAAVIGRITPLFERKARKSRMIMITNVMRKSLNISGR